MAEHRGIDLPPGMTPELADRLERLVCDYIDAANSEDDGDMPLPLAFGVTLFEEIRGTLRS